MAKLVNAIFGVRSPHNQAMVEVDVDPLAERVLIIDRDSGYALWNTPRPSANILRVVVPLRFATSSNLLVGIMDDTREYNAKFLDGVKAQIVDGSVVKTTR